jgi:hypothetical protein
MSSIFSWIKKQVGYFFSSIPEIIKALVLFSFTISGLGGALLMRYFDQSSTIILAVGLSIEALAMIAVYIFFKKFLKSEDDIKPPEKKQIKK